jgi:hypothetical protein
MQNKKIDKGRKRSRVPKDSENYNSSNIIPQGSANSRVEKYGDISAKASCGNYKSSRGVSKASLEQNFKTNHKPIVSARQSAFSTHKRRKIEEEKDNPLNEVFSSSPQRSGELV